MSKALQAIDGASSGAVMISFGKRYEASQGFDGVFREGMALVEEAAAYLDGQGRRDAKRLQQPLTVLYATESMRLTTRLLDLASWLLIRRALKEGEISEDDAKRKRKQVKLKALGRPGHIKRFDDLPQQLRSLIERSFALQDRIVLLDRSVTGEPMSPAEIDKVSQAPGEKSPVAHQLHLISEAFGRR